MTRNKRIAVAIVALILIVVAFQIVSRMLSEKKKVNSISEAVPVAAVLVKDETVERILRLTGDIKGLNEARVFPKVPGRLMKKVKDLGERVEKGEVVALIDRDEPALKFAPAEVTSPLSGVLTRYFLDLGQNVTPAAPVFEVAEVSPIKVVVGVPENDFPGVRLGQTARFSCDAYPKETFTGKVARISEALDTGSRTSGVEIQAENPGHRLKPGMFARVELVMEVRPHAAVIPLEALSEEGSPHVFVVSGGKASLRPVELGIIRERDVEIRKGLKAGEEVVRVGWQNLRDGSAVEVVEQ